MSAPIVIATWPKNTHETVRVALDQYRGADLIDLRVCVELAGGTGIQAPTGKGLSLRADQIPTLLAAVTAAHAKARELGWLNEPGGAGG